MSTIATPTSSAPPSTPRGPLLPAILRSEWTKFLSLRSSFWTLVSALAATIGLGAILSATYVAHYSHMTGAERARFDPVSISLSGLMLAQLAIGVLGILIVSGEYSTGLIRSTFAAVPQRRLVLVAKGVVLTVVIAVVGIAASLVAFFLGQAILSGHGLQTTIQAPGVLRAVVGGGLYLTVLSLLALGLGTLIRHSAGAIAALFGLLLVLPGIVQALPASWANIIGPYLPSNAGEAIFQVGKHAHSLGPWVGFGVFCAYAAAALLAAGLSLTRRDA